MAHKSVAKAKYVKKLGSGRVVRRTLVGIYGDWVIYEAILGKGSAKAVCRRQIQFASWKKWLWGARMVK